MLSKNFCSSPWFHIRLRHDGQFAECRWGKPGSDNPNIRDTTIMQYYDGPQMRQMRTSMVSGSSPDLCSECIYQDQFGKINGRHKQLLKSGIRLDQFELSTRSSPHYQHFLYSNDHDGASTYQPVDLQIDLGNVCNSACIMCNPSFSSRLQSDYKKLHRINPDLFSHPVTYTSWTRDPALLDKFVQELSTIPNIRYIHFLGGETLYDESFYIICDRLIELGLSKDIIVGTTTNGTIYDHRIERLIGSFKEFHLGVSIESVTPLNDYIRYPSRVELVLSNLQKFLDLRPLTGLNVSLRITPNIFTIGQIDSLFEYMIEKQVTAESCGILKSPDCLRMELLPDDLRSNIITRLSSLVDQHQLTQTSQVNIRRSDLVPEVTANLIIEYLTFLKTYETPADITESRQRLVPFLKSFETIRNNTILDYAPEYTDFLRSLGY
jgi:sulfatase maturation enzyme AslB (radical SAM superfamily)